jgi:hypothetical protein
LPYFKRFEAVSLSEIDACSRQHSPQSDAHLMKKKDDLPSLVSKNFSIAGDAGVASFAYDS